MFGLYGNLTPNITCQQKKEKRPIKEFSLCTTRLVHAESPARHTCQASVGEIFFDK